jgi:hypothetical protein
MIMEESMHGSHGEIIRYPLTSYQQDVWVEQCLYSGRPIYNIGGYIEIQGNVNYQFLQKALNRVIENNAIMRIRIVEVDGKCHQEVSPQIIYDLPFYNFSNRENAARVSLDWMNREFVKPFNFDSYLFQFALLQISNQRFIFFCKAHHLITDGWGYSVFIRQLFVEYRRLAHDGNECSVPPSYIDFIPEDQKYTGSISCRKDIHFWRQKFQEIPELFFNSEAKDRIVGSNSSISGCETLTVKRTLYNRINSWSATKGCSTFHFILGILFICFYKISGQASLTIGVPILNRKTEKLKRVIGHFANIIPLKIRVKNELFFEELLIAIKSELRECYRHQKLAYGEIYRTVFENNRDTRPLFEIALS